MLDGYQDVGPLGKRFAPLEQTDETTSPPCAEGPFL